MYFSLSGSVTKCHGLAQMSLLCYDLLRSETYRHFFKTYPYMWRNYKTGPHSKVGHVCNGGKKKNTSQQFTWSVMLSYFVTLDPPTSGHQARECVTSVTNVASFVWRQSDCLVSSPVQSNNCPSTRQTRMFFFCFTVVTKLR